MIGCGGKNLPVDDRCEKAGSVAPEWVCGVGEPDALLWAVGHAAKAPRYGAQTLGARDAAYAALRSILRERALFLLEPVFEAGPQNGALPEAIDSGVDSAVAQARTIDTWRHPGNGSLYLRVGIERKIVQSALQEALKIDEVLWLQTQSAKAQETLYRALEAL